MTFYKYLRSLGFPKYEARKMLTIRDQWTTEIKRKERRR